MALLPAAKPIISQILQTMWRKEEERQNVMEGCKRSLVHSRLSYVLAELNILSRTSDNQATFGILRSAPKTRGIVASWRVIVGE